MSISAHCIVTVDFQVEECPPTNLIDKSLKGSFGGLQVFADNTRLSSFIFIFQIYVSVIYCMSKLCMVNFKSVLEPVLDGLVGF